MDNNICLFIPKSNSGTELHIVNLVLETKGFHSPTFINASMYKLMLVKQGTGTLQIPGHTFPLERGDLFFCLPSLPYFIAPGEDLEYMYISFLGPKANMILDSLGVNRQNFHFRGFEALLEPWERLLNIPQSATWDLKTEALLLYTLSVLGDSLLEQRQEGKSRDAASAIKRYVDDHYFDSDLSLETISKALSYSSKYISTIFKKSLNISLFSYLNTLRIQHACTFMEQNLTSIKDISAMCGFKDQLYFAKVFKAKMGYTPKEYIARVTKK